MRFRRNAGFVISTVIGVLTLTGCAVIPPHPHPAHVVSPPAPSAAPRTPTAAPTPTRAPSPTPTHEQASVVAGMVGPYPVEVAVDNGPEPYAEGTVTRDAAGVPIAYLTASGDIMDYIAERFGFFDPDLPGQYNSGLGYINTINEVRRGGYPWTLYAGDVLNLSPYRITAVGSQDGVVKHEPPPSPMPPQQ